MRLENLIFISLFLAVILLFTKESMLENHIFDTIIPVLLVMMTIIYFIWKNGLNVKRFTLLLLMIFLTFISTYYYMFLGSEYLIEGNVNYIIQTFSFLMFFAVNRQQFNKIFILNRFVLIISLVVFVTVILDFIGMLNITNATLLNFGSMSYGWIYYNPNTFAQIIFFLLCYIILFFEKKHFKIILIVSLYLLMLLTLSRTGILAGAIITIAYFLKEYKFKVRNIFLFAVILITIFLIIDIIPLIESILEKQERGTSGRILIWSYVINNDILNSVHALLLGNGFSYGSLDKFDGLSPHNSMLLTIGRHGLIYFILLIILLILYILHNKIHSFLHVSFYLSVIVYASFESSYFVGVNGSWLGFIFILLLLANRVELNNYKNKETPRKLQSN